MSGGDDGSKMSFSNIKSNLIKPAVDHEKDKELIRSYIPGLHIPGQNFPKLPENVKADYLVEKTTEVDQLIRDYNSGQKNPVSVIHEYCSFMKLKVRFEEQPVHKLGMGKIGCYGNACFIEDVEYPAGCGNTKKEAKTEAAREAFKIIMRTGYIKPEAKDQPEEPTTAEKSPISLVYEFCQSKNWDVTFDISDVKTDYGFRCDGIINGTIEATKFAVSKNVAKKLTAEHILRVMFSNEMNPVVTTQITKRPVTHFDSIANLVMQKVEQLVRPQDSNFTYLSLAAFVIKKDPNEIGQVVAIGTGNGCIDGRHLVTNGRILVDCHAEVIARRALLKYLYGELTSLTRGGQSIFEFNESPKGKIKLKELVSLHMYLSSSPCGDAAMYETKSPTVVSDEEWKCMEKADHCPSMGPQFGKVFYKKYDVAVKMGSEFRLMSCSDKILKWNLMGVQGSLLSHLIEPLYINSFTFGDKFNFGNLTRALCCRLPQTIDGKLPQGGYQLRHPFIGRVAVYKTLPLANPQLNLSVNWCSADKLVEFVDQDTGLEMALSPFQTGSLLSSRLSKMGFFHRFKLICAQFGISIASIIAEHREAKDKERMEKRKRKDADEGYDGNDDCKVSSRSEADDDDDDDDNDNNNNSNNNNINNNDNSNNKLVIIPGKETYGMVKCDVNYNKAKRAFKKFLVEEDLGLWSQSNKQLNNFTM